MKQFKSNRFHFSFSCTFIKSLKFTALILIMISFYQCSSIPDEDKKSLNAIIDEGIGQMEKEIVAKDFFSKLGYPETVPEIIFSGDPKQVELSAKINKNLMDFEQEKKISLSAIYSSTYLKIVNSILKEQNKELLPGEVMKKLPKKWLFVEEYREDFVGAQLWSTNSCEGKTMTERIDCVNTITTDYIKHMKDLKDLIAKK
jgi:hypothetical protein